MTNTNLLDKNGNEIHVGDIIEYRDWGTTIRATVELMGNGLFYPFDPSIEIKFGLYTEPSKCVIVKRGAR